MERQHVRAGVAAVDEVGRGAIRRQTTQHVSPGIGFIGVIIKEKFHVIGRRQQLTVDAMAALRQDDALKVIKRPEIVAGTAGQSVDPGRIGTKRDELARDEARLGGRKNKAKPFCQILS